MLVAVVFPFHEAEVTAFKGLHSHTDGEIIVVFSNVTARVQSQINLENGATKNVIVTGKADFRHKASVTVHITNSNLSVNDLHTLVVACCGEVGVGRKGVTDVLAVDFQCDELALVDESVLVALAVIHLDFSKLQVGSLGDVVLLGRMCRFAHVGCKLKGENGVVRDVVGIFNLADVVILLCAVWRKLINGEATTIRNNIFAICGDGSMNLISSCVTYIIKHTVNLMVYAIHSLFLDVKEGAINIRLTTLKSRHFKGLWPCALSRDDKAQRTDGFERLKT